MKKQFYIIFKQVTQEGEQQEGAIPQDIFDKEWSEEGRLIADFSSI